MSELSLPSNPWILGSFRRDFLWLHLPGLLGLLFALLFQQFNENSLSLFVFFFALTFVDNGHVYTTFWRSRLNPREQDRSWRLLWVVLGVFLFLSIWAELELPGFWSFVIYATLFHNIRQLWGLHKWYGKLSRIGTTHGQDFLFHIFTVGPLLIHLVSPFRSSDLNYFVPGDLWHFPQPTVFWILLTIYLVSWVVLAAWSIHQAQMWLEKPVARWGLLTPALVYAGVLVFANDLSSMLLPLVLSHGVAYYALMAQTSERLELQSRRGFYITLGLLFLAGVILGGLEEWGNSTRESMTPDWIWALLLTPLFSHYVLDAFLWRRRHPQASVIFAAAQKIS